MSIANTVTKTKTSKKLTVTSKRSELQTLAEDVLPVSLTLVHSRLYQCKHLLTWVICSLRL